MAFATLQRLRDDLAADRSEPTAVVAAAGEYATSPVRAVREETLALLATAAECDPACGDAAADAVAERLRTERGVSPTELRGVWTAGRAAPASMEPVVLALGRRLADVERLREATRHVRPDDDGVEGMRSATGRALVASVVGVVGERAPGAAKPAIPALVACCDASAEGPVTREAMWALVATATAEPAVLRPFVAGRVWALDETDPRIVATALDDLGHVGAALPNRVPAVDRVRARLDHDAPRVRAAAVRALGRIGGAPRYHGKPLGRPLDGGAAPLVDPVTRRLHDGDPEVRAAAAGATECLARAAPGAVADHHRRLDAVADADDWLARTNAARATATVVERTDRVDPTAVARLRALLADTDPDVRRAARRGLCAVLDASPAERGADVDDRRIAELLVVERFYAAGYTTDRSTDESPDAIARATNVLGTGWVAPFVDACRDHDDWSGRLRAVDLGVTAAARDADDPATLARTLEAFLADDDEDVRERALEGVAAAADRDPDLAPRIARSVAAHATEGPGDLDASLPALARLREDAPVPVEAALARVCRRRTDTEDDDASGGDDGDASDGGMQDIVREALDEAERGGIDGALAAVADEVPEALTAIVDDLVDRTADLRTAGTARALFTAVAEREGTGRSDDAALDREHVECLLNLLKEGGTSTAMQAWTAGTVVVADPNGRADAAPTAYAGERLHSLVERDETADAIPVVARIAEVAPRAAAPFVPAALADPDPDAAPEYARLVGASDAFVLPVADALTDLPSELDGRADADRFGALAETDWWPRIAAVIRTAFPLATDAVAVGSRPDGSPDRDGGSGSETPWRLHPVPNARPTENGEAAVDPAGSETADGADVATVSAVGLAAARAAEADPAGGVDDGEREWRRVVRTALAAEDPAVRRTAVRAADHVFAATGPDAATAERLVAAVDDADPLVRAAAARVACRWSGATAVDDDALAERVPSLLGGSRPERRAACEGTAHLLGRGSEAVDRLLPDMRGQLTAAERGVRRRAAAAFGRAAAAERLPGSAESVALDRLRDAAVRGKLAVAIDAGGGEDGDRPAYAANALAGALVETNRERTAHAVGSRLHRLAATAPAPARTATVDVLRAAIGGTERGDEGALALGTETAAFWFCRTAARLAASDRSAVDAFETVVEGTLDRTAETGPDPPHAGELGRSPTVDGTALRRAALSAAGYGALEAFPDALAASLADAGGGSSLPDPAATAAFLRRADADPTAAVADVLADAARGGYPADVVSSLAAGADAPARREAELEALARLVPTAEAPNAIRPVAAAATDALDDGVPTVRRRAVTLLAALGEHDRVPADEALAHLLGGLRDDDVRVRRDAADAIAGLAEETSLGRRAVERIADRLAAALTADAANGGVLLAHALAVGRRVERAG